MANKISSPRAQVTDSAGVALTTGSFAYNIADHLNNVKMANKKLLYASDARKAILKADPKLAYCVDGIPGVDAISVAEIEAYLKARLDEWNALGDRKWEPANMWGYNFIRACFDDLERRTEDGV